MNGWPIARIRGFEIRLHVSWIPILAFLTISIAGEVADLDRGLADPTAWWVGGLVSLGFLGSVLVHELAHAIVARRRGVPGGPITLFFFGGTASVELEAARPEDEIRIAAAGPIASLLLGFALIALSLLPGDTTSEPLAVLGASAAVLGVLNVILGAINLVPGFPLDGGRVIRAIVWGRRHDERAGTRAAALAGRILSWVMTGAGFVVVLVGDGVDGLMLIVSGWFLGSAASAMDRRLAIEDLLEGARVDEATERDLPRIPPQLTLDTFADQLARGGASAVPVVRDDRLLGLIGLAQLRRVARRAYPTTRAEDMMVRASELPALGPDDALWPAVETMRRTGLDGLPVFGGGELLGLLTRRGVGAVLARRAHARAEEGA